MIKIFAKRGTNLKCIIPVPNENIHEVLLHLNATQDGDWVLVDVLKPGEGILFSDGMAYQGFHPDIERYSDRIIKVPRDPIFIFTVEQ
jgi:hypothetical protein